MRRYLKPLALLLILLLSLCACSPADLETLDSLVQIVGEVAEQIQQTETPSDQTGPMIVPEPSETVEEPADEPEAELVIGEEPGNEQTDDPEIAADPAPEADPEIVSDPEPEAGLEIEPAVEIEIPADVDEDPAEAPIEEPTEIQPELPVDEPEEMPADPEPAVAYGEDYYSPEDVALYLHLYRELPPNYLTKAEARDWGWESSEGNLWDVFPGGCIGGDRFGNYEELLPDGNWTECDVNYEGGYRNGERLVFNREGAIYYTNDHYESFTQLYEGWAEE